MKFEKFVFVLGILLMSFFVSAYSGTSTVQYNNPSIDDLYSSSDIDIYWPGLDADSDEDCSAINDFYIGVVPGGCSPMVVRSDLLEEQNVPVFCQLYAIQVNPLIDVFSIDSISFSGDYPDGVSGVTYYPAKAAVKSDTSLEGSPTASNIGYVVIRLKQEKVEDDMEDWISGNLTAKIRYDSESAYGTGKSQYYLQASDGEDQIVENSFWNGRGYLQLKSIEDDEVTIELLDDEKEVFKTIDLEKGETSKTIYFPGSYCRAGLQVKLNSFVSAEDSVLITVDGDELWVRKGSTFLNGKCKVSGLTAKDDGTGVVDLSCSGKKFSLSVKQRDGEWHLVDNKITDNVSTPFLLANQTIEELVDSYRSEKISESDTTYGESALFNQIQLAGELNQFATQMALASLFIEKYPSSGFINSVEEIIGYLQSYDYEEASRSVYVSNDYHFISAKKFRNIDDEDENADFSFEGKDYNKVSEDDERPTDKGKIRISKIDGDEVTFRYIEDSKTYTDTVSEGEYGSLNGKDIRVTNVDSVEVAYVSLSPAVDNKVSEASFSFSVGIEKRAIQLSPEKTRQMIENLKDSIERWEDINTKLGSLVTAMKGACFATSAFLTVKNMVSGMDGTALARKKVMEDYRERCTTEERYRDMTLTQCYNELSEEIDNSVEVMAGALSGVNTKMDDIIDKYESDGGISDSDKYVSELRAQVPSDWRYSKDGVTLTKDDLTTSSQISAVLLVEELDGKDEVALKAARAEMDDALMSAVGVKGAQDRASEAAGSFKSSLNQDLKVQSSVSKDVKSYVWGGDLATQTLANKMDGISTGDKIQAWELDGKNYLLKLKTATSNLGVEEVYSEQDGSWKKDSTNSFSNFVFSSGGDSAVCSYVWEGSDIKASYYESGEAKGMPAVIPFDLKNGWYVKVSSDAYTSAGEAKRFKICNIGSNIRMDSSDKCQTFDVNTVASVESFGGCEMTKKQFSELYSNAAEAIRAAAKQYGQKDIEIDGQSISTGAPSTPSTSYDCQDFMSPSDCSLLFNVCDPVICPTSRCDMGGKMQVTNVAQTGILGSILLCLPNYQEGIKLPVCLTGIHAGIESYVSILKSERDCLETSLETGENVGICDEITSIYLCEFFWNQFSVFFDTVFYTLFDNMFGANQNVRGGGEYLLVEEAWQSAEDSFSYFKDFYAQGAFAAFAAKSVENAGSEVCNAFIGTGVPTNADMLESLLEPESPTQFYARFSSTTFSDVTVPVTSQYKVYYHIFAGEDQGVQYKVYLTDPPESSYYKSHAVVNVDSGYVAAGETVDEAKDFTAPEGYKQLCVVINGVEECGFTSVSTDLAVDYVSSKYVEDQASEVNITTESECLSGSSSTWSFADLNLQSGAQNYLNPEIALDGIVRVCATSNPGNSVGDSTRWKNVGYCGETSMGCWLDITSVQDALKTVAAVEGTDIEDLESMAEVVDSGDSKSSSDIKDELNDLDEEINGLTSREKVDWEQGVLDEEYMEKASYTIEQIDNYNKRVVVAKILARLDKVIGVAEESYIGVSNRHKARAYFLKARVYQKVAEEFFKGVAEPESVDLGKSDSEDEVTVESEVTVASVDEDSCKTGEVYALSFSDEDDKRTFYVKYENDVWAFSLSRDGSYGKILSSNSASLMSGIRGGEFAGLNLEDGCELVKQAQDYKDKLEISTAAKSLIATCKSLEDTKYPYANDASKGCFDSIEYIYSQAGVTRDIGESGCFSENIGVEFFDGEVVTSLSGEDSTGFVVNPVSCFTLSGDEDEKLDGLEPGDFLSIVIELNGEKLPHSVIFVEWVDEDTRLAKIFDWGVFDKSVSRTYVYSEIRLSNEYQPVYMYWKPVSLS